jgi:hypothetical protein
VKGTDGKWHVAYELVLTNTSPVAFEVTRVDVRDARTGRVVLSLAGEGLAATMNPLGSGLLSPGPSPTTVAGSGTSIVWLDVTFPRRTDVPRELEHVVTSTGQIPASEPVSSADTFERVAETISSTDVLARVATVRENPLVLGPPVGPGLWFASDGCCAEYTHHRHSSVSVDGHLLVPQRFAIDWFLLDEQHRAWVGDPRELGSYLGYRQPLIAAADGTVVETLYGLPNSHPPNAPEIPPSIGETVGNHVTLRIAPGVYLLYAHMDTGSVRVRKGQHVRRGQVLGLLGTSGYSATPHLHFQVMTTRTYFPTDSPPYVFDRFDLVGQVTERIWDDDLGKQPTGELPYEAAPDASPRRREMPLDRNVIRFP